MGTLYKIDSRTLVFASLEEGFFPSNVPPRRHSGGDVAGSVELTISGPGMEKAQSKGELVEAVTEAWENEKKAEAVVESFAKLVGLVENKY
jgi:hypothetical protein